MAEVPFKERGLERLEKLLQAVRDWPATVGPVVDSIMAGVAPYGNEARLHRAIVEAGNFGAVYLWLEFIGQGGLARRLEEAYQNLVNFAKEADQAYRGQEGEPSYYEHFATDRAELVAYVIRMIMYFLGAEGEQQEEPKEPSEERWSEAMTKAEMARRYFRKVGVRFRKVESILKRHGLKQVTQGKYLWTVRLDLMDAETRRKLSTPLSAEEKT